MAKDPTAKADGVDREVNLPLRERLSAIARDAQRLADHWRGRAVSDDEIDDLWGHRIR